ncbi:MAG: DUF1735 and LamG domain-containing protein [Bacteroidales bacterium]|nr:DUF1735 and LamG domain-containing protein [Bacteroidales bacterium]MDE6871166.1 DUF1735 and LamG domain-containing protein [Bacteroidales bacterium]
MNKIFKTGIMLVLAASMASCTEGDKFDPDREIVLISGTDDTPLVKVDSDVYGLTVSATGVAKEDVTVYLKYDKSAVEAYNAANRTNYQAVPESAVKLDSSYVVIRKGQASSMINNLTIVNHDYVEEGYIYVVPIVISDVNGGGYEILESTRSVLVRPTNEYTFNALDINTPNMSSNYIFPDEKAIELSTYTYEIKFYAYSLKDTGTDMICRLCAWEAKDESKANMLRFGENGYPGHSLQLVSPAGNIVSETEFDPGKWYMLSLVYDGSTMTMYVNGVPEPTKGTGDGSTTFQRFEMGMSYQGYNSSQLFSGRIAEVRVWNRALSVSEMKEGVCNVPKDSEGLCAYWRFNEGEGHIFHDSTGNGYDMDWSDTWRAVSGDDLVAQDKGTVADGRWVFDEINVCRN